MAEISFSLQAPHIKTILNYIPSFVPFVDSSDISNDVMMMSLVTHDVLSDLRGRLLHTYFCNNGIFDIFQLTDGFKIAIRNIEGISVGLLKADNKFNKCYLSVFGSPQNVAYALNNALMIAFTFSAAYHHVLLMHASVVVNSNQAFLFLGKSGTGKSTHSQLWLANIPGSELLNDDTPAVRVMDDGTVWAYGTPWSGKTPCYKNQKALVQAFVKLEQHSSNIIVQQNTIHSFATILSSSSSMLVDKQSYKSIIATVESVVGHIPTYLLKCLPNKEAAILNYETIIH